MQPPAGGNAAGQRSVYPCKVTLALQRGWMARTIFCGIEPCCAKWFLFFLLLLLLLQAVFWTWQKHGELSTQVTDPQLQATCQAGSGSCTRMAVGLLHEHFVTVKQGLDLTGSYPDN